MSALTNKLETKGAEAIAATASGLARLAIERGQHTYCPVLAKPSGLAGSLDTWALAIDAIEAEGWRLEHWATAEGGTARPIFRRRPWADDEGRKL